MADRGRRGGARVVRAQRQPTNWARFVSLGGVVLAAGAKALITTVTLSNPGINETVRRTRGILSISSNQEAANHDQIGALGLVVVSDLAIAAGAGSIPGPVTDASDDGWFVWLPFTQRTDAGLQGVESREYHFDSKVMRRVEEGFGVAFMIENGSASNAIQFNLGVSLLSSLS